MSHLLGLSLREEPGNMEGEAQDANIPGSRAYQLRQRLGASGSANIQRSGMRYDVRKTKSANELPTLAATNLLTLSMFTS